MRRRAPRTIGLPSAGTTPFLAQIGFVVIMLSMLASACGSSAGTQPAAPAATRQLNVGPVNANGSPAAGFHTTATASHATCEPGSEAIGQAYRCFAGNFVYDPCWAVQASTPTVLCVPYPWVVTDARLSVSMPLGAIPNQGRVSEPWGVQLASGQRCVLLQGAHSLFEGQVIDYYCNAKLSLLRGLMRSAPVWRARSVEQKAGKTVLGPTLQIRTAWFGRPDTFR